MAIKYKVNAKSGMYIRSGPGINYDRIDAISYGTEVTVNSTQHNSDHSVWCNVNYYSSSTGWICKEDQSQVYLVESGSEADGVEDITEDTPPPEEQDENTVGEDDPINGGYGYTPDIGDLTLSDEYNYSNLNYSAFNELTNVVGCFGLPYQFLPDTDYRTDGSNKESSLGIKYAENIVSRIPLVFLSAGKANFMTQYDEESKRNIIGILTGGGDDNVGLNDLLNKNGSMRYYTFEYDMTRYYSYVNPMCRLAARFYELDKYQIYGEYIDQIDWSQFTKQHLNLFSGMNTNFDSVPFYINTDTSISESFNTSLTDSSLANTVNSISEMGRELNFLLGTGAAVTGAVLESEEIKESMENVQNIISNLLGKGNFLNNLTTHLETVATGGKLMFPQIWQDTTYTKSYDINIKLTSPDCNRLSVFLNIIVPLLHLIALAAPQSVENNPNGYSNPFLIRALYKGFFNIDMGIITSMSINRGAECQWTPDGVPTVVDVNITIKDLYDTALTITPSTASNTFAYNTMTNTALMDYLANLVGVNVYKPEIGRLLDMAFTNAGQGIVGIPTRIWTKVQDVISTNISNLFRL